MAFLPIARVLPQYVDLNGDPASGFVLKAFAEGTSNQINFATDNTGSTLVGTIALNASGYPEVTGNEVIPHLDENYKLFLYPTQAAADADSGETWVIDNIIAGVSDLGGDELTNLGDGTARTSAINVGQVQDNEFLCLGTTSGSADAYELTPSVPITAYATTQQFTVKIHATNTTTTPYLQISSIADPATNAVIKKLDASKAEIASEAGDYTANGIYTFKRNSANTFWIGRDADIEEVIKVNSLIIPVNAELTIDTGAIIPTDSHHTVDTEGDASTDDLDTITITNLPAGKIVILSIANNARNVVIKHGTGNIITNDQTDITLDVTNDRFVGISDGTNIIELSRTLATDLDRGFIFIEEKTASSSAQLDFTDLTDFDSYFFILKNVVPATNAVSLQLRVSDDNGSTFKSGASDYKWAVQGVEDASGTVALGDNADSEIELTASNMSNSSTDGWSGTILLINPKDTSNNFFSECTGNYLNSAASRLTHVRGGGSYRATAAIDAARIRFSSGNISTGSIKVYGIR